MTLPRGPRKLATCPACGDTGWRPARVVGRAEAVVRCGCRLGRVPTGHRAGCTRLVCTYGHAHARAVRNGEDGSPCTPGGAHPLALVDDSGSP